MAKRKKLDLEKIPDILQKATALIDKEITSYLEKDSLTSEESRNLVSYVSLLSTLYKDYRSEVTQIKKELKDLPKEDLTKLIKAEAN